MVFNSIEFLIFAMAFFPLYYLLKGRARIWLCLSASYLFYGWWDWRFLGLVLFTTTLDFSLGLLMHRTVEEKARKRLIIISVISNLGFLGFFKYFNFFIDSFSRMAHQMGFEPSWHTLHIILPIGISFYTFQSMSYTIDVYRKEFEPERDFIRFAAFVSLFPQLVAGPIVRAKYFLPQFRDDKKFEWDRFISGTGQILWGFFKKVAIADSLAPFVDQCFGAPTAFSQMHLMIGVIFYSFQIYCDFSGYSDIANGLARMMGFDFPVNFRTPYFSQSFSEFWTRWHISLSSWLRDYLYIPLGGNRGGKLFTYRNLMLTMLLGGLWHGANWNFVFWGFLHGFYLVVQRLISKPYASVIGAIKMPGILVGAINIAIVYALTCFAWIFFRSPDFGTAVQVIKSISEVSAYDWGTVINKFFIFKGVLLISMLLIVEISDFRFNYKQVIHYNPVFRVVSYATLLWILAIFGTFGSKAFIYFQF